MTEGEYRVGVTFNPSNNVKVDYVKIHSADLIDFIIKEGVDPRTAALAATAFEDAAMWAVKAITKQPKE
jgi:hypothetical protein